MIIGLGHDRCVEVTRLTEMGEFYSICIHILSQIYAAHTFLNYTEQMWAGYVWSSPGLVAAHHYWMHKEGYSVPPDTQDSCPNFGQEDSGVGA
jgi:hypothetical protein